MTNFYTSDQHFFHKNMTKEGRDFCGRPYNTVEEMNVALIKNWNSVVTYDDTVYVLGDFAMGNAQKVPGIISQLQYKELHLIFGNHDAENVKALSHWDSVQPYLEVIEDKQLIVLCHYKFTVFNRSHHGAINLFGHSHSRGEMDNAQQCDVGVDNWNYTPVTLAQIKQRLKSAPQFRPVDHHGRE